MIAIAILKMTNWIETHWSYCWKGIQRSLTIMKLTHWKTRTIPIRWNCYCFVIQIPNWMRKIQTRMKRNWIETRLNSNY